MTDDLHLIEKIQQNQAEIAADLELLKERENPFANDIEALRQHQACAAEAVEILKEKMQADFETEPVSQPENLTATVIKTRQHFKLFWDCKLPEQEKLRELNTKLREIGFIAGYPIGANRLFNKNLSDETLQTVTKLMEEFGFSVNFLEEEEGEEK